MKQRYFKMLLIVFSWLITSYGTSYAQCNRSIVIEFQDGFVNDTISLLMFDKVIFEGISLKSNPNSGLTSMRLLFTETKRGYYITSLSPNNTYKIRSWLTQEENLSFVDVELKSSTSNKVIKINLKNESYIGVRFDENLVFQLSLSDKPFDYD